MSPSLVTGVARRVSPLLFLGLLVAVVGVTCRAANEPASPAAAGDADYMKLVQTYADAMIAHGRDTYGTQHSPLFASAMDRKTFKPFEKSPGVLAEMRDGDRTFSGANPMHDQNLYQILYTLTGLTGQPRYAQAADEALKWFFEHCQSSRGLMAWGEHQGWNFYTESSTAPKGPHEFFRPWVLWGRSYQLAPEACRRFATGLWEHQIADHEKGLYSRHAMPIWETDLKIKSSHAGAEFPRHGGFYIATWAEAYFRTKDPQMLKAVKVVLDGFLARRNPQSGAIPSGSRDKNLSLLWPESNLSLAIDLCDAAPKVTPDLAGEMLAAAAQIDEIFLKMKHEPGPGGKGFIKTAVPATLEPGDERAAPVFGAVGLRRKNYTEVWATGYGVHTTANFALACEIRYNQTRIDGYRKLVIAAADLYLQGEPDLGDSMDESSHETRPTLYPGAMGDVIAVELAGHRLTGDQKYLARANHYARMAVRIFLPDDSPLPRVSSRADYYEALSRGDYLMAQLLNLWAAQNHLESKVRLIWCER
ncbi:MAG: hypothetical protein HS122_18295 [Opitutaceae bacterium]|nr:hypothetical protein [Opitutaceae bacterium]